MKTMKGKAVIGNNVTRIETVPVYSREEARKILDGKDWRASEDLYDVNTYEKIATGVEWDEVEYREGERYTYTTGIYYI